MEENKSKKLTLAIFIILGTAIFLVAIFVIGSKQNLFTPTIKLKSDFETASGLLNGSSVRFNGIDVGTVNDIEIISGKKVRVEMTIESSVKKFIKRDSRAKIVSEGLVGNKIIEITSGSDNVQPVNDGDMLESIKPVEAEDIFKSLKETGENASVITKDLSSIVAKVDRGEGTLGQLVNNTSLYNNVDSTLHGFSNSAGQVNMVLSKISKGVDQITTDVIPMTEKIRNITSDIAEISRKMNSSESVVGTLLTDTNFANNLKSLIRNANQTTANLEQGSFSFAQNMEALKHNFLFKGYFEDIGYWNKTGYEKNLDDLNEKLKLKTQELDERDKQINELQKKLDELQGKN